MAYYVFSALDASLIPGPLIIRAGVSPASVDRAVASIDEELRKAGGGWADRVRNGRIGAIPHRVDAAGAGDKSRHCRVLTERKSSFDLGLDYDLLYARVSCGPSRGDAVHAGASQTLAPSHPTVQIAGPYAGELR